MNMNRNTLFVLLLGVAANSAAQATTIFVDDFPGSGGVPSGWSVVAGSGTVSHASSIVTIDNSGFLPPTVIRSTFAFDPQPQQFRVVAAYASILDPDVGINEGGFFGITGLTDAFNIRLDDSGSLEATWNQGGPAVAAYGMPSLPTYAGGAVTLDLLISSSGFQLTSAGYDSGFISWLAAYGGLHELADVGSSAQLNLGSGRFTTSSLDSISAALVPLPAAAWLFGGALGIFGWLRRKTI
jgi:hypothetical protein